MSGFSWVTLATNDSYSLGALVLAHSLKRVGTAHQLVVMVTPGVTQSMREKLRSIYDLVFEVNILDSKDERNLLLLQRPELGITFTKLHCWRLTQYNKCVFLDADTLVLQNCDELFDREEFSAAPDVGWPDCFNSGVFVYKPSDETFNSLLAFALERGSFDGGDQGLLNLYFSDWAHKDISKHLPFIYNMCSTACYSYLPAFKQFGENVKIIHFIGNSKPWLQYFNSETLQVSCSPGFQHLQWVFEHWWNLFCTHVHPGLQPAMGGLAGALAQMSLREPRSESQNALEDHLRRQGWESGRIDYLGQDSFDNVWKKICETMAGGRKESSPSKEEFEPAVVRAVVRPAVTPEPDTLVPDTLSSDSATVSEIGNGTSEAESASVASGPVLVRSAVPVFEPAVVRSVPSTPEAAAAPVAAPTFEPAVEAAPESVIVEHTSALVDVDIPELVSEDVVRTSDEVATVVVRAVAEEAVVVATPAVIPDPVVAATAVIPDPVVAATAVIPDPVVAATAVIPDPVVAATAVIPDLVVAATAVIPDPVVAATAVIPDSIVVAPPAVISDSVVASPGVIPDSVVVASDSVVVASPPVIPDSVVVASDSVVVATPAVIPDSVVIVGPAIIPDSAAISEVAATPAVVHVAELKETAKEAVKKSSEPKAAAVQVKEKKPTEEKKQVTEAAGQSQSSEATATPVPPPRKSGKNGGATAKKTTKKK